MNRLDTLIDNGVSSVSKPMKHASTDDSPKIKLAKEWLTKYPDMQGLSLREAAKISGLSYSTLKRAKDSI